MILRFDQSDRLKVSFGRYHTPINYWNTAFHHGQWLQTTIARPEMIQFGGRLLPVHFVGALVEGSVPAQGWNLNYKAGLGNGRATAISRGGDAGDVNGAPRVARQRIFEARSALRPRVRRFGVRRQGDDGRRGLRRADRLRLCRVAEGGSRDHRRGRRDPARGAWRPSRPGAMRTTSRRPTACRSSEVCGSRTSGSSTSASTTRTWSFRPSRGSTEPPSACGTTHRR